jgi:hypothetical protein
MEQLMRLSPHLLGVLLLEEGVGLGNRQQSHPMPLVSGMAGRGAAPRGSADMPELAYGLFACGCVLSAISGPWNGSAPRFSRGQQHPGATSAGADPPPPTPAPLGWQAGGAHASRLGLALPPALHAFAAPNAGPEPAARPFPGCEARCPPQASPITGHYHLSKSSWADCRAPGLSLPLWS